MTREERRRLAELSPRAFGFMSDPAKVRREASGAPGGEGSFSQALSRHSIRLFLSAYALSNAYENIALGILKRKR